MEPFISMIIPWPSNFAPRGWSFCKGQFIPINQNQSLFSLLGTTFGGDGVTNFALPNLGGRTIVGTGTYPGIPEFRLGIQGGIPTNEISSDMMPAHIHTFPDHTHGLPEHTHPVTNDLVVKVAAEKNTDSAKKNPGPDHILGKTTDNSGTVSTYGYSDQTGNTEIGGVTMSGTITVDNTPSGTSGATGGNTGSAGTGSGTTTLSNLQPFLALNYIIALDGLYPSRS
ncbi:MAG: tail fiber protein [Leptospirales bacterium]